MTSTRQAKRRLERRARYDNRYLSRAATRARITPDSVPNPDGTLSAGMWLGGFQAQAQAPVSTLPAERHRYIGGHLVKGAYSDPWWLARPGGGWAVSRRWRSKAQDSYAWEGGHYRAVAIPAVTERITEPWPATS